MRALIADDDRITTTVLSKTLQAWHVEPAVAHDGRTAWDLIKELHPSLAVIDWMMPELDGPELCRRIRREPLLAHMYVILLTGRNSRADVVAGLDAGADDYIVKPFDRDELRARVHVGMRVARLQERLSERVAELQRAQDELARLASTDPLTGLYSRRRWFELAGIELARFHRYNRPLTVLMLDVDHFKRVNDQFGHDVGDEVLKRFADGLRSQCRQSDVICRMGGEEFAVLLPETTIFDAEEIGGRIADAFRGMAIELSAGMVKCSCSIGVAEVTQADDSVEPVLRRADAALYQAKRNGRDRVETHSTLQVPAVISAP